MTILQRDVLRIAEHGPIDFRDVSWMGATHSTLASCVRQAWLEKSECIWVITPAGRHALVGRGKPWIKIVCLCCNGVGSIPEPPAGSYLCPRCRGKGSEVLPPVAAVRDPRKEG
jgi:hypothetical protein